MSDVFTVPCPEEVSCKLTVGINAQCPIKDEIDAYQITVSWKGGNETFEKWWLLETITGYEDTEATQEEICAGIYNQLMRGSVNDIQVDVRDTKHMDMIVSMP